MLTLYALLKIVKMIFKDLVDMTDILLNRELEIQILQDSVDPVIRQTVFGSKVDKFTTIIHGNAAVCAKPEPVFRVTAAWMDGVVYQTIFSAKSHKNLSIIFGDTIVSPKPDNALGIMAHAIDSFMWQTFFYSVVGEFSIVISY